MKFIALERQICGTVGLHVPGSITCAIPQRSSEDKRGSFILFKIDYSYSELHKLSHVIDWVSSKPVEVMEHFYVLYDTA